MWPFENITRFGYRQASKAARLLGSEDYAEFLNDAGHVGDLNKTYTPKPFLTPASENNQRESDRYTNRVVNEIAPNTETAVVTGAQMLSGGIVSGLAVEQITDEFLKAQGEAPTRSLTKMYSPIAAEADYGKVGNFVVDEILGIRRDNHYANGGAIDQHAVRKEFLERPQSENAGNNPTGVFEKISGFFKNLSFGAGSLFGAFIGILAMFISPMIGGAILIAGLLFGQKAADYIQGERPPVAQQTTNNPNLVNDSYYNKTTENANLGSLTPKVAIGKNSSVAIANF